VGALVALIGTGKTSSKALSDPGDFGNLAMNVSCFKYIFILSRDYFTSNIIVVLYIMIYMKKTRMLTIRLTPQEHKVIKETAFKRNVSMAYLVKQSVAILLRHFEIKG